MMTEGTNDAEAPGWATATPIGAATVRLIVLAACRAPSIHNSQPWRWVSRGSILELWVNRARHLHETDPSGRDLTISCGAGLHHALIAASAMGFAAVVDRFPDPTRPDLLARISLRPTPLPDGSVETLEAIEERCTDRRRFTAWPIPQERIERLVEHAIHPEVAVATVTVPTDRLRIDLLVSRAVSMQAGNPAMLTEQVQWMADDRNDEASSSATIVASDSLLVLSTADDGRNAWLHVGESLSALWIAATLDGLSIVPLSRIIECEATRSALQRLVLGSSDRPQLLLRVGWQRIGRAVLPRTSRLPLAEVLEVLS